MIPRSTPIPIIISDYTVAGGLYLYYNWLPKLSVGIGGTFGYTWVDEPSTNQTFEQINLRLNYEVTYKLSLYASGGVEFRQFDGNRDTYDSPVFEVGVAYHPLQRHQYLTGGWAADLPFRLRF